MHRIGKPLFAFVNTSQDNWVMKILRQAVLFGIDVIICCINIKYWLSFVGYWYLPIMCQDLSQQMALKLFQGTRFVIVPRIFCFNLNMGPCVSCCSRARLCVCSTFFLLTMCDFYKCLYLTISDSEKFPFRRWHIWLTSVKGTADDFGVTLQRASRTSTYFHCFGI